MTRSSIFKSLILILLGLVCLLNISFLSSSAGSNTDPIVWISDGSDQTNWSQMYVDSDFTILGDVRYTDDIEIDEGEYTAADRSAQTGWWDAARADTPRRAGIFRDESLGLAADAWEFTMTVDVENAQQTSGAYTFKGYMIMNIFNANKEMMLGLNIRDAAGSSGETYSRIEYRYFDAEGMRYSGSTADRDPLFNIDDEEMGIKKNSSGIYWKIPGGWSSPITGDWVYWGSTDTLLTRGTPTYLTIDVIRQERQPTEWSFDDITFKSKSYPTSITSSISTIHNSTTTSDISKNTTEEKEPLLSITSGFSWIFITIGLIIIYINRRKF